PNMIPTSGINTELRNLIRRTININTRLARKVKASEENILAPNDAPGIKIKLKRIPIFAASSAPAVVGATNLFCDICCMMKPEILSPAPVKTNDSVRGNLLTTKNINSSPSTRRSAKRIDFTPVNKEIQTNTRVVQINNRYNPTSDFLLFNSKKFLRQIY